MAKDTRWDRNLSVAADADGLIGHAGAVLLRKLADQCGLTPALGAALGRKEKFPLIDRGMALVSMAVAIALGATSMSDIAVLAHQEPVLGAAPSDTTVRRTLELADPATLDKIARATGGLQGKTLACLGLSFKPNTSDTRDSPAIRILGELVKKGVRIRAYDPAAMEEARRVLPDIAYADNPYEAARECDALVIATEWNQFRSLDWERIKKALKSPIVVDLRNVYEPDQMRALGFAYTGVGR